MRGFFHIPRASVKKLADFRRGCQALRLRTIATKLCMAPQNIHPAENRESVRLRAHAGTLMNANKGELANSGSKHGFLFVSF